MRTKRELTEWIEHHIRCMNDLLLRLSKQKEDPTTLSDGELHYYINGHAERIEMLSEEWSCDE